MSSEFKVFSFNKGLVARIEAAVPLLANLPYELSPEVEIRIPMETWNQLTVLQQQTLITQLAQILFLERS